MSATLRRLAVVSLLVAVHTHSIRAAEADGVSLPVDRLVGTRVGDFRLPDVVSGDEVWFYGLARANGFLGRVMGLKAVRAAVLVFVSPGCPLGEKYLPRLGELATRGTTVAGCRLTRLQPRRSPLADLERVRPANADIAAWLDEHEPAPPIDAAVTWNADIATIMQAKCQSCHRPGQVGGFSLLTYDDAYRQSAMIAEVVENRRMPPWHADPRHGRFVNDRRLSATDRAKVLAWVAADAPRGEGAAPAPRAFIDGWTIGRPDVVIEIPAANLVPAQGTMPYVNVSVPTAFTEDVWVQAAEARPGDPGVVHHIIVFVEAPGQRRGRGAEGLGHLCGYAPGDMPSVYPPGTAKRIAAGSTLRFQLHYTPNGVATTDRSKVGLILATTPPEREAVTLGIANSQFVIPPGAAAHPVRSQVPVLRPTRLLSFMPHMHLRGTSFRYTLERVGSKPEVLLDVPAFDFGWQSHYVLAEPRDVNLGARIVCDALFDNSPANRANPDPTKAVTWGEQTWEEMMIGYIDIDFPRSDLAASKPQDDGE